MCSVRSATHSGSWYTSNATKLKQQLDTLFKKAQNLQSGVSTNDSNLTDVKGARILVGPHAGYTYSGERLAEAFNSWDISKVKRIFLLGPSHHVYFKNYALLSPFEAYETPLGNLPVDIETCELLSNLTSKKNGSAIFKYMSEDIDEDEHSFEMHAPFIYYKGSKAPNGIPSIIPILISGMDDNLQSEIVESLLPFVENEENHFIISSDFCHWGSRFGYTKYLTIEEDGKPNLQKLDSQLSSISSFGKFKKGDLEIFESIEMLDKLALKIASSGSSLDWKNYIKTSGNTICGQKPISIILKLLESYKLNSDQVFNWIGYSQSNPVKRSNESSVSYASGYVFFFSTEPPQIINTDFSTFFNMSDGKLFSKCKSTELRAELELAFKKSKPNSKIKVVLHKVIANIILNNHELVHLMKDIISLLKIDDIEIRKLCFEYVINYGMNSNEVTEVIPYLNRFKNDSNPILRSLTLKAATSINKPDFNNLSVQLIKSAFQDPDPYLRKTAAYSVSRLFQHDPIMTEQENLVEELNQLLYDDSPLVISNALASLNYITENSRKFDLVINKNHTLKLISLLLTANEWQQTYLINSLMSYIPQDDEESLNLIEHILPGLQHENSSVVLNSIKVIVYFCNYCKSPELRIPILSKRLGTSLCALLSKDSEIQFLVLRNVILLLLGQKNIVHFDVEMFYCKFDDPIYIKDTKLEIIYLLANQQNVSSVLLELEEYATEVDISMARKAIRAFGNLAVKLENAAESCVEILCDLISNGISYIVQESAIVLKNILRKYPGQFNYAIEEIIKQYKLIDEPDAKTAIIWIIGQCSEIIADSKLILSELIANFKDDPIEVQLSIITATTKMYLKNPIESENILNVLKIATEEVDNPDIRDRGFMYWRLLSSEHSSENDEFQSNTKKIVLNDNPIITSENDNINPQILEELELNIGTLASIYLKPVSVVFRLAKHKQLPKSPALQRNKNESKSTSSNNSNLSLPQGISRSASPHKEVINRRMSASPNKEVLNRRMSYRRSRSNSDQISNQSSFEPKKEKENFTKEFTRKALIFTNKLANK
ncbi:unnamed protein product [Candida verbasci]|uniref:Clathrin/coatomer adaptor adaptin-like N-terminal domain-containing protein n=1 Tax=Candida verbasci TaxID=1227364 RepID=A0A9W4TUS4_9ASCO|nr:unnamed protein product [Candida verbasci]